MVLIVLFCRRNEPVNLAEAVERIEEFIYYFIGEGCGSGSFLGVLKASIEECFAFFLSMDMFGVPD